MEFLPLVVDGILILIFAACIFDGRRKGFVKMVLSVIAVIISIGIAHSLSVPVAAWANESFAKEGVSQYIEEQLSGMLETDNAQDSEAQEMLPEELKSFIEKYDISLDGILEDASIKENVEQTSKEIAEKILDAVLLPILETVCFILIYIISSSLLSILVSVIGSVFRLPIINGINKALGGVLGAVKGLAVISVLSVIAVFAAGIVPENELTLAVSQASLTNAISETVIQLILGGK